MTNKSLVTRGATAGQHTKTIILLHGRGSDGTEFASDLLDNTNVLERLRHWRWVFPSSTSEWNAQFDEYMHSWFDVRSLSDPEQEQSTQITGLRDSTRHLIELIRQEVKLVGGHAERLVLGGISQGEATALWTLLNLPGLAGDIGGFVGMSGWLPFASHINRALDGVLEDEIVEQSKNPQRFLAAVNTARSISKFDTVEWPLVGVDHVRPFISIPVFLGHGKDDSIVEVQLGRKVRSTLQRLDMSVTWREYEGAEQDGHWVKEPEELDDVIAFLKKVEGRSRSDRKTEQALSA